MRSQCICIAMTILFLAWEGISQDCPAEDETTAARFLPDPKANRGADLIESIKESDSEALRANVAETLYYSVSASGASTRPEAGGGRDHVVPAVGDDFLGAITGSLLSGVGTGDTVSGRKNPQTPQINKCCT